MSRFAPALVLTIVVHFLSAGPAVAQNAPVDRFAQGGDPAATATPAAAGLNATGSTDSLPIASVETTLTYTTENGETVVTRQAAQTCLYAAALYVAAACNVLANPGDPASLVLLAGSVAIVEALYNNAGYDGLGVVAAQNAVLQFSVTSPLLSVVAFEMIQNGPAGSEYFECENETTGAEILITCLAASVPAGAIPILVVTLQSASEAFTAQMTTTAEAGNGIGPPENREATGTIEFVPPGMISGRKIHDLNGNGTADQGEPGLSGWEITLEGVGSTTTDQDGNYVFEDVPPGEYTVSETSMAGWIVSAPEGGTQTVTVESDQTVEGVNFLNYQPGEIRGRKFSDDDGDGEKDDSEEYLQGWTIELISGATGSMEATTDSEGRYAFTGLPPASYGISEVQQGEWTQTHPEGGEYSVPLESGQIIEGRDFGNQPPQVPEGSLIGRKVVDLEESGVDSQENVGQNGVTIELRDMEGSLVASTQTSSMDRDENGMIDPMSETGWFAFRDMPAGQYTLNEILPPGHELVSPQENLISVSVDPDFEKNLGDIFINQVGASAGVDFGDLPDPREDAVDPCPVAVPVSMCYPTLVASLGPMHAFSTADDQAIVLGEIVDGETDGQPDPLAVGDDENMGSPVVDYRTSPTAPVDDEDGLQSVAINQDGTITMEVMVTDPQDDGAYLDVWIDLNDDGHLADPRLSPGSLLDEQVFISRPVSDGLNTITSTSAFGDFNIVPGERLGYLRMRLSSTGGLMPIGPAFDGEVEDHYDVAVDFGDAPANEDEDHPEVPFGYETLLPQNGARHAAADTDRLGDEIDAEGNGQTSTFAFGDDTDSPPDDEDGVIFGPGFQPLSLKLDEGDDVDTDVPGVAPGADARMIVLPSVPGMIDAWFDWNRDGDWDDDGERALGAESVTPEEDTLTVQVPATAEPGLTFARIRFSSTGTDSPTGFAPDGEVEDYLLLVMDRTEIESTGDAGDGTPGDGVCDDGSGVCTLRAAIEEANASTEPTVITFGALGKSREVLIEPESPLPAFETAIVLDGAGMVALDGSQAGAGAHGLHLQADGSTVRNTAIVNFDGDGIRIEANDTDVRADSIVGNGSAGVRVVSGTGNSIRALQIDGNGALGIDLGEDGMTPNDPSDSDTGPNGLVNFPVLTSATAENGLIEGTLDSTPETEFALDIYANAACDASGAGQGFRYLGAVSATTDASGTASFTADLPDGEVFVGDAVTATATAPDGSTSEFSECFTAVSTQIERTDDAELPGRFSLEQNYPNPFNPETTIEFAVPESEFVRIDVYDLLGKHVARIVNRRVEPGQFSVRFDASALPSGTYIYRMTAGEYSTSRQFTLLK